MDYMVEMLKAQRRLQIDAYHGDPELFDDATRIQFMKDMVLALTDEAHELLAEIGWKPWATSRHINREEAVGELVDMFHFFMNLMIVLGMDVTELYERYMEKRSRNIARQQNGYDGIAGKCPGCKRDFSDIDKARSKTTTEGFRIVDQVNGVPTEFCSNLCATEVTGRNA